MSVEHLAKVFRTPPAREPDNDEGELMPIIYNASRPNYHPPRFEPRPDVNLLAEITVFLARKPTVDGKRMTEGKFGCLSCGNYYIVRAIRGGARLMPKTEMSIREFMRRFVAS